MTDDGNREMILKVTISLLMFSLSEQDMQCLPNLRNIAVYEGYKNILMNLTADPNNVAWFIFPTSDEFGYPYLIWEWDVYGDPSFTGLFYLNQSGLVILYATTTPNGQPISTAGLYFEECGYNADRREAKLVVVRAAPECSCNGTSLTASQLSCSIRYADLTRLPINANMTWKIGDVVYTTETPERTRIDNEVFESRSTITVESSVSENYTCVVTFNAPVAMGYPFIATNAPEFSASCSVEVYRLTTTPNPTTTTTLLPTTTTQPPTTTMQPPATTSTLPTTTTNALTTTTPPQTTTTTTPLTTTSPLPTTTTSPLTTTEILTTQSSTATTGLSQAEVSQECLNCICKASGCEKKVNKCTAVGNEENMKCGPYQISKSYYLNVTGNGTEAAYKDCTYQMNCSEEIARTYLNRNAPICVGNGTEPTCEDYVRVHYAGPEACRRGTQGYKRSNGFSQKVKKCRKQCEQKGGKHCQEGSGGSGEESEEGYG